MHHWLGGGGRPLAPGDQVGVLGASHLRPPGQDGLPGADLLGVRVPPADHPAGPGEGAVGVEDPLSGPRRRLGPGQQSLSQNIH